MTIQQFLELRHLISVAHHVPGRIRLKLHPDIRRHPAAAWLDSLNRQASGVLSVRLNVAARSLVMEYDRAKIAPKELEELLTGADQARAAALAETFTAVLGFTPHA